MKDKENNTDRWNFARSFPRKNSRFVTGINRFFDFVTPRQLVFDKAYQFSYDGRWYGIDDFKERAGLFELVYNKRRLPDESRKKFFERYLLRGFETMFDRIMEEIILHDGIFVFPRKQAFLFAAQLSPDHPKFRYDIKTGSGQVGIFMIVNPEYVRLKANIQIILFGEYRKMLDDQVKSGHKYQDYATMINEIQYGLNKDIF